MNVTWCIFIYFLYKLWHIKVSGRVLAQNGGLCQPHWSRPQTCTVLQTLSHLTFTTTLRVTGSPSCFWWKTWVWETESFTFKLGSNSSFRVCIHSSHTHHPPPRQSQFLESILSLKMTTFSPTQNIDMMLALIMRSFIPRKSRAGLVHPSSKPGT